MIKNNDIPLKTRLKELFIDWLVIVAYLFLLFLVATLFYQLVFGGIPLFSEVTSQLIATMTSVVPIVLLFSYLDWRGGSIGKKKTGLRIHFKKKQFRFALIRNVIKFLPWQLGHMATIHGIYHDFDTISLVLQILSIGLMLDMFAMGILRKDKRHFADFLAGSQVQAPHSSQLNRVVIDSMDDK
ncbi:RDD family protein [Streptococcus zalophi]|uniref:RDD family protein n=1 Tax=Streptococcus zalophi TaxID=640031 RepID=A0A934UD67_9STRE|nr:RDD family protein [Streptococcus zalophi]MBJ8349486.1 RDD family protein [Streptococcus zalophi]